MSEKADQKLKSRFDVVFYIVIGLALFILTYLSVHLAGRITEPRQLIRFAGTIVLPVPVVIYLLCLFAYRTVTRSDYNRNHIVAAVVIFIATVILSVLLLSFYEKSTQSEFKDNLIIPSLINSSVTLLFALNHVTRNDERIAGFLSGLLLGMALFIFIF